MIKISLWQRFIKWLIGPLWENFAIDMCEEHRKDVLPLSLEKRKEWWELVINDETIDIKFRHEFEKNHKHHFDL